MAPGFSATEDAVLGKDLTLHLSRRILPWLLNSNLSRFTFQCLAYSTKLESWYQYQCDIHVLHVVPKQIAYPGPYYIHLRMKDMSRKARPSKGMTTTDSQRSSASVRHVHFQNAVDAMESFGANHVDQRQRISHAEPANIEKQEHRK